VRLAVKGHHRLRGGGAFAAVRERRASASSGPLRVQLAPNRHGVARVGFVIPKAVGGAVVRNRVRRRLRALMTERLDAQAGLDVVVSAGAGAVSEPWGALGGALDACLAGARARLRRGHAHATAPSGRDDGGTAERPLRDNRGDRGARTGRDAPRGCHPASP
jgi:ribonuclease P protein component